MTQKPVQRSDRDASATRPIPTLDDVVASNAARAVGSTVVFSSPLFDRRSRKPASNVVAVVNADPITRKTLADEAVKRYGVDVLDNMVNRHLILQECRHNGIEVTKQQVRDEIRRLAAKFGLSLESYLQLLQEERDISPNQYSREIIWPMLALRRLVADKVQVTDEEFNRAFISQFGEAVKCRLIMVAERGKADDLNRQATANPSQFSQLGEEV